MIQKEIQKNLNTLKKRIGLSDAFVPISRDSKNYEKLKLHTDLNFPLFIHNDEENSFFYDKIEVEEDTDLKNLSFQLIYENKEIIIYTENMINETDINKTLYIKKGENKNSFQIRISNKLTKIHFYSEIDDVLHSHIKTYNDKKQIEKQLNLFNDDNIDSPDKHKKISLVEFNSLESLLQNNKSSLNFVTKFKKEYTSHLS